MSSNWPGVSEVEDVDIMSDSLSFLGEHVSNEDDDEVRYGELVLHTAPKEGKALTLLADQLFSPSLLLAEKIERGLIDLKGKTVIELGAGCALPSLLAATMPERAPSLVLVTDYPDEIILSNLRYNVQMNQKHFQQSCTVLCKGYEWGTDAKLLIDALEAKSTGVKGFDVVILSDLLHFHNSHHALLSSLTVLLARTSASRSYIAAGTYTPPHVCNNFVRLAEAVGLLLEEGSAEDIWRGSKEVWKAGKLSIDQLGIRKAMCRWWVARWNEKIVATGQR